MTSSRVGGEWLTFRELSFITGIDRSKLRYLRDSGVLTDLGMVLYQRPCRIRSRWFVWVPRALCENRLPSLPAKTDYSQRDVSKP
jgi:hypothetical protein